MLTGGVLRVENLLGTWGAGACFAGHEDQNCASSTNSRGELVGVNGTDLAAFERGLKIQWSPFLQRFVIIGLSLLSLALSL